MSNSDKFPKVRFIATEKVGDRQLFRVEIDGHEIKNVLTEGTKVVPYKPDATIGRPGVIVHLAIYTEDIEMDSYRGHKFIIKPPED